MGEAVGEQLTDALTELSKEKYLLPAEGATVRESALSFLAAHLRAHDAQRSDIYREKRQEELANLVSSCTIAKRLRVAIERRRDVENNPDWTGEDEREYHKLCKEFDLAIMPG